VSSSKSSLLAANAIVSAVSGEEEAATLQPAGDACADDADVADAGEGTPAEGGAEEAEAADDDVAVVMASATRANSGSRSSADGPQPPRTLLGGVGGASEA
jgi:hypothetical protein